MVSLKHEYCEIVMTSQWKIEFFVTFCGFWGKTAEFWETAGKTRWETVRAADKVLQARGVTGQIRASTSVFLKLCETAAR